MKKLLPLVLAACAHVAPEPTLDTRILDVRPTPTYEEEYTGAPYVGMYKVGFYAPPNVPHTLLGASQAIGGPGGSTSSPTFSTVTATTRFLGVAFQDPSSNYGAGAGTGLVMSGGLVYLQSAGNTGLYTDGQKLIMPNVAPIIYASGATTKFQFTSNVSAANTNNTTQPVFEFIPQNALDATDLILAVRNSVGADRLTVDASGDVTAARSFITSSTSGGVAVTGSGGVFQLSQVFAKNTAPTISSGFGSSPSVVANNGTVGFTINVGTGGAATSGVIGLPTAATGWRCSCDDITTKSATVDHTKQTAVSTTSCTVGNFNTSGAAAAWVASDILVCSAFGY